MTWIEFITVVTSLAAIWIAGKESRRNNRVVVAVRSCQASAVQAAGENSQRAFHVLDLTIKNKGLSLHDVQVCLEFRPPDSWGRVSVPLTRRSGTGESKEFAKGMVLSCVLKSYALEPHSADLLGLLADPTAQDANLCIYSQGYFAAGFRVGGRWDRLKSRWNRIALWVNEPLKRKVGTNSEGHDVVRRFQPLPRWCVLGQHFQEFCADVRQERSSA